MIGAPPLLIDTLEAQAERTAAHGECGRGCDFTAAEPTEACELGCASKFFR